MAPRSIATWITLLLIPRLAKRFDMRSLIVVGVLWGMIPLHPMTHFTQEIRHTTIISSGLIMQWMTLLTLPLVLLFSRINPMAVKRRTEDEVIHVD
jgi:sulfite exporter TauE/SafE